jgi:glycosyltransferase involved in cell wall biosynthesis
LNIKKIKILILSDYAFTKGGAERVAISSAIGLSQEGHEVVFFSAVGPIDDELLEVGLKEVICLNQSDILDNPNKFDAILSGVYNWRAVRRLKKLFSCWVPDIAHIHGVSKALSWAPVNLIYSYKIPIIYTLHDYGLLCPNLGIYNFRSEKVCEYYKPGNNFRCLIVNCDKRNYAHKLWRWIRFFIVRNIFKISKKVSGFVAVSKFMAEMTERYLAGDKPVRVIYNPVEINKPKSVKYKGNDKKRRNLLYVGRLSLEKGIDLLLSVMSEVNASLTVIGDGELMNICGDYSCKLGSKKIRVLGFQSRKRIYNEMRKSSALILPSRCMEPAPLVLTEAAYNCLPSIVANHGGLVEFVEDGITGLHFEAGSKESLKECMEKIIKNPILSKKMGQKAEEIITKKGLSVEDHLKKIERYYVDILENKSVI